MTVDDIVACRWWSLVWHEAMKPGKASAPSPHLVRSLSSELTHQHLQQHANRLATWVAVSIDAMCPKFELGLEHTTREPMLLASFGNHNLQCRLDPRGVRSATLKASIASFAVLGFSQRGWEHGQGALETPTELIRAPVDGESPAIGGFFRVL